MSTLEHTRTSSRKTRSKSSPRECVNRDGATARAGTAALVRQGRPGRNIWTIPLSARSAGATQRRERTLPGNERGERAAAVPASQACGEARTRKDEKLRSVRDRAFQAIAEAAVGQARKTILREV